MAITRVGFVSDLPDTPDDYEGEHEEWSPMDDHQPMNSQRAEANLNARLKEFEYGMQDSAKNVIRKAADILGNAAIDALFKKPKSR